MKEVNMVRVTFRFSSKTSSNSELERSIRSAFSNYTGKFKKTTTDDKIILEYFPMHLEAALTKVKQIDDSYSASKEGLATDVEINTVGGSL